jgi:glycosyltransferase involved in cell wall biosynthesis
VKKRVLQILNSFHQGGSERQAVQLTRLLCDDGTVEVFLVCLNNEGVLRKEVEKLGFSEIPEFKLTSFFNLNFLSQVMKCANFIRHNKIEIVHTHDFYSNVFGMTAGAMAGVHLKIASKRETAGMRSKAQKVVEKFAFGRADKIVANAGAVKNYLVKEGISDKKIEVIYNGLDLARLKPKETDRTNICKELGLPIDKKIKFITMVANLRHKVKNQPMFLRVAQKVLHLFPETHFVLAGEGELQGELEKLAEGLQISKNIHFIGRCTKVPELLWISDVCVLTSFNEGFSNSILEYMSAGKPVVATRVGGAKEAIIEGETGFLVESNDDKAFADRITELLQHEEKAGRFGDQGRKIVEEKFSCQTQLERTLKLYQI